MGVVGRNATFPQQVQENKISGAGIAQSLIPLLLCDLISLPQIHFIVSLPIACTYITAFVISR